MIHLWLGTSIARVCNQNLFAQFYSTQSISALESAKRGRTQSRFTVNIADYENTQNHAQIYLKTLFKEGFLGAAIISSLLVLTVVYNQTKLVSIPQGGAFPLSSMTHLKTDFRYVLVYISHSY